MRHKNQKGFTLIEILVVIAIIGMLAGLVLLALNTTRSKSRDTKRQAEFKQIVTAMSLYYNANASWPSSGGAWVCVGAPTAERCYSNTYTGLDSLVTALSTYLPTMPTTAADAGTSGYNRFFYNSSVAAGAFVAGSPAGAYMYRIKENPFGTDDCSYTAIHPDKYYLCPVFLGPP